MASGQLTADPELGQKRPRLEAAGPGGIVMSEPEYKSRLLRLLKLATPGTIVDILATVGARYQPVYDEIFRVIDGEVSARKLFVRNISFEVEEAQLRGVMAEFGELTECMVAKDRATGKGRGFAFVTYAHVEDADKAITAKSRPLEGRDIFFSLATDREKRDDGHHAPFGGPGGPLAGVGGFGYPPMPRPPMMGGGGTGGTQADREARRFMVRNLSWQSTGESLRRAFVPYGEVEESAIPLDRETGKSKGYGFVVMKYLEGSQAVQMGPPSQIDGRDVQVSVASAARVDAPAAAGAAMPSSMPTAAAGALQQQQLQQLQLQQQQFQHMQAAQQQQQQAAKPFGYGGGMGSIGMGGAAGTQQPFGGYGMYPFAMGGGMGSLGMGGMMMGQTAFGMQQQPGGGAAQPGAAAAPAGVPSPFARLGGR